VNISNIHDSNLCGEAATICPGPLQVDL